MSWIYLMSSCVHRALAQVVVVVVVHSYSCAPTTHALGVYIHVATALLHQPCITTYVQY